MREYLLTASCDESLNSGVASSRMDVNKYKKNMSKPDPSMVKLFFETFNQQLQGFPIGARSDIFALCRTRTFSLNEIIYEETQKQPDMHFVVSGSAMLMKQKSVFKKFLDE